MYTRAHTVELRQTCIHSSLHTVSFTNVHFTKVCSAHCVHRFRGSELVCLFSLSDDTHTRNLLLLILSLTLTLLDNNSNSDNNMKSRFFTPLFTFIVAVFFNNHNSRHNVSWMNSILFIPLLLTTLTPLQLTDALTNNYNNASTSSSSSSAVTVLCERSTRCVIGPVDCSASSSSKNEHFTPENFVTRHIRRRRRSTLTYRTSSARGEHWLQNGINLEPYSRFGLAVQRLTAAAALKKEEKRSGGDGGSSDNLVILNANYTHTGSYTCLWAFNHEVHAEVQVEVVHAPEFTEQPISYRRPLGHEIRMRCTAHGGPVPTITWLRNNITLPTTTLPETAASSDFSDFDDGDSNNNYYVVETLLEKANKIVSELIIKAADESDNDALFACAARNKRGVALSNEAYITVFKGEAQPNAPRDLVVRVLKHDTVELAWKPPPSTPANETNLEPPVFLTIHVYYADSVTPRTLLDGIHVAQLEINESVTTLPNANYYLNLSEHNNVRGPPAMQKVVDNVLEQSDFVSGLRANTTYVVAMQSFTGSSKSSFSPFVMFRTPAAPPLPKPSKPILKTLGNSTSLDEDSLPPLGLAYLVNGHRVPSELPLETGPLTHEEELLLAQTRRQRNTRFDLDKTHHAPLQHSDDETVASASSNKTSSFFSVVVISGITVAIIVVTIGLVLVLALVIHTARSIARNSGAAANNNTTVNNNNNCSSASARATGGGVATAPLLIPTVRNDTSISSPSSASAAAATVVRRATLANENIEMVEFTSPDAAAAAAAAEISLEEDAPSATAVDVVLEAVTDALRTLACARARRRHTPAPATTDQQNILVNDTGGGETTSCAMPLAHEEEEEQQQQHVVDEDQALRLSLAPTTATKTITVDVH